MHRPMWEKGGIFYGLYRSIQGTNGELAAALLSLPEKNREIIFLYFFGHYTQREIGEMYGRCRSMTGYQIRRTLQLLHKEMEVLSHGESEPFAL